MTRDGGARWQTVNLPHPRVGHGRAGCLGGAACYLTPVTVTAHVVELYAGGPGASADVIYRSTNGRTWAVEPLPLPAGAVGSFHGAPVAAVRHRATGLRQRRRRPQLAPAGRSRPRRGELRRCAQPGPAPSRSVT